MQYKKMFAAALLATALMLGSHEPAPAHGMGGSDDGQYGMMGPGMMGPGMMGPGMMGPGMMRGGMMGQGYGMAPGMMGPGYGMAPGMMGPGCGMAPGMMGRGMMGPGMMGPGMMGQGYGTGPGMMGRGMMGQGYGMAPGYGMRVTPTFNLTADDVRNFFEGRLEMRGNKRLRVGKIEEKDKNTITADIETVDGSLVQRYAVDRHTGLVEPVEQ